MSAEVNGDPLRKGSDPEKEEDLGSFPLTDQEPPGTRQEHTPAPDDPQEKRPHIFEALLEAIRGRFDLVEELRVGGQSGLIYVIKKQDESSDPQELRVIKMYQLGTELRKDAAKLLIDAKPQHMKHMVRLYKCEKTSRGYWYEILEHVPGKLDGRKFLQERKGQMSSEVLREMVRQIAEPLSHLNAVRLGHRDLKPENLLIRGTDPLDLAVSDFGLAIVVEGTEQFASREVGTWEYAAPERFDDVDTLASDWWSLGMIILEALLGTHPMLWRRLASDDKADSRRETRRRRSQLSLELRRQAIDLSGVEDERFRLLLTGLLNRDYEKRWGAEEVSAWLRGESPAVRPDSGLPTDFPFTLDDKRCTTPAELAKEIAMNGQAWEEGKKRLARGDIHQWVRDRIGDYALSDHIADLEESDEDLDVKLFRLILRMGHDLPPTYMGYDISREGLAGLAAEALKNPESKKATVVESLFHNRILSIYGENMEQTKRL